MMMTINENGPISTQKASQNENGLLTAEHLQP